MNESNATASPRTLISVLKETLTPESGLSFAHMVLYTAFGVVHGRTGMSFIQEMNEREASGAGQADSSCEMIELHDVTVEHYSNHLPTASFDRFYIRLDGVQGFALADSQMQG